MKKHSTGALTKQEIEEQEKKYSLKSQYDYVIIGTGMAALTVGALLANAGKKICMLEAHDKPGGYAHTFTMGKYSFCSQIHYIWGCAPGGKIYEFLKKINLHNEITFELFDSDGYDHMVMPDGTRVKIPFGFDKLVKNIARAYPGQEENLKKFTKIIQKIQNSVTSLPEKFSIKELFKIQNYGKYLRLIKYKNATLQNIFDECKLSKETQAVLIAQAGDMMAPPKELSIFSYVGLFGGYNTGAYYPRKHFKFMIERIAKFITDKKGCDIFYEEEVNKIKLTNKQVSEVITKKGKTFFAKNYICNMDPQAATQLIGRENFPSRYLKKIDYEYSPSAFMIYLGLKNIDLKKYGFGNFNIWHLEQWDMNKMFNDALKKYDYSRPWIFISTPTLHSNKSGIAPPGGQILEITTVADYNYFKSLQKRNYRQYLKEKNKLAEHLINILEKKYIPEIRKHIAVKIVGTPTTNEDFCLATKGSCYGSHMNPKQMGLDRLKSKTPFKNFFWCNASSGYPGIYGTIGTGMSLYSKLTGDKFYKK